MSHRSPRLTRHKRYTLIDAVLDWIFALLTARRRRQRARQRSKASDERFLQWCRDTHPNARYER